MTAKARQFSFSAAFAGLFLAVLPIEIGLATPQPSTFNRLLNLPMISERMQPHDAAGIALYGFDPVSYKLGPIPVAGKAAWETVLEGVAWRFASEANMQAFLSDPASFIPAFDGYDATAISAGRAVEGDPLIFVHVGSRIFFFRSPEARERFLHAPSLQREAEIHWPAVMAQLAR
jgi:YHS domain-containing protein